MWSTTCSERRTRSAPPTSRLRWPLASPAASSALVLAGLALAGCGGHQAPALDRADAHRLIALADRVATVDGGCAQQRAIAEVQAEATRLVNARHVPPALQESLMSAVNALVADQPTCLPSVPAASTTTSRPTPSTPPGRIRVPRFWPPGFRHHRGRGPGPGRGDEGDEG